MPRPRAIEELGRHAGLGLKLAGSVALFGAAGWWLDGKLGTTPWLLILGLFLGAGLAFASLLRAVPSSRTPPNPPNP
jgi:F0F1-type ATP synthase assembly protein I